jgi:Fic family protein
MSKTIYDRTLPYNELPLLPPSINVKTYEIEKAVKDARIAILHLYIASGKVPNASILINTIAIREAKQSSTIENIFTTESELYKALAVETAKTPPTTKEVLRYREALWTGFNALKKDKTFSVNTFIKIYQEVKQLSDGIRNSPVDRTVIKKSSLNKNTTSVVYTPPRGEKIITEKLNNLIEFLNNDKKYDYDPLVKLAIAHYQFEAIHPFRDGNGRTGRIVNSLVITEKTILKSPILYLSRYILQNLEEYYHLLNQVTILGKWDSWILYILKGIYETATYTENKLKEISNLLKNTEQFIYKKNSKFPPELIQKLFEQPYINPNSLQLKTIKSLNTTKKYLDELVTYKILRTEDISGKTIYFNADLYDIVTNI